MHGEKRNAFRVLVENPEGRRPKGRRKLKWEYDIKKDIRGIE
jgi:hypothetical protein